MFKLKDKMTEAFYIKNPDFDLEKFNLNRTLDCNEALDKEVQERLLVHQRLMGISKNVNIAQRLLDNNLHSSHQIAKFSEEGFVNEYKNLFEGDEKATREIHQKAVDIKEKVAILWANLKDTIGSPHYKESFAYNESCSLENDLVNNYQDIFGGLDYYKCDEARSILSPAAYFVDLMRLVEEYITVPNKATIKSGLKLKERRPDLFQILINKKNTNELKPYLEISNGIMEDFLKKTLNEDVYEHISKAHYPFNLPFHLPLEKIRSLLKLFKVNLYDIYSSFKVEEKSVNMEILGLCPEDEYLFSTKTNPGLGIEYDFEGFSRENVLREIKKVETFLEKTGLTYKELENLCVQGLSEEECKNRNAELFFINLYPDNKKEPYYMHIVQNLDNPKESIIEDINEITIDCINRFIRLSKKIGWSFEDLTWVLKAINENRDYVGQNYIYFSNNVLQNLAAVKKIENRFKIPLDEICALWYDMKTIGMDEDNILKPLFDRVFNMPIIFYPQYGKPYHPIYMMSFPVRGNKVYSDDVLSFNIKDTSEQSNAIRSSLQASLGINENELVNIINYLMSIREVDYPQIRLTLPNMSLLYRTVKLSRLLEISIDEYLMILNILNIVEIKKVEDVVSIYTYADWLKKAGLNAYQVKYMITGENNYGVCIDIDELNICNSLKSLWKLSKDCLLNSSSFLYDTINEEEASQIFMELIEKKYITDTGIIKIDEEHIVIDTFRTIDNKKGVSLEAQIMSENNKKYITYTIKRFLKMQKDMVANTIALTLKVSSSLAKDIIDFTSNLLNSSNENINYYELLLTGFKEDTLPDKLKKFFHKAFWIAYIVQALKLKEEDLQIIVKCHACYDMPEINNQFSFKKEYIETIYTYKMLENFLFKERKIKDYLSGENKRASELAGFTKWDEKQLTLLCERLNINPSTIDNVDKIYALYKCFNIADNMKIDMHFLLKLTGTKSWKDYNTIFESLLYFVNVPYENETWSSIYEPIESHINEMARDALIGLTIKKMKEKFPSLNIKDEQDLYQYFLIDFRMSGGAKTSPIKQALDSLQLYIQRCRMNLEAGVNKLKVPEIWWKWMSNYRIWEANRKVFLYPENYIQPELRKFKTPIFKDFEEELMQGNITEELVEEAYKNYFNSFEEVANLKIVSGCLGTTSEEEDTLFIFGRTKTEPYAFYYTYRVIDKATNQWKWWGTWEKIDQSINATNISPIFAFGKLFIFWPEITKTVRSDVGNNGSNKKSDIYKSTIKYSFYNANKKWIQPQILEKDIVFYYSNEPSKYLEKINQLFTSDEKIKLNIDSPYWNIVKPLYIASENKIIISYGEWIKVTYRNYNDPIWDIILEDPYIDNDDQSSYHDMLRNFASQCRNFSSDYGLMPLLPIWQLSAELLVEKKGLGLELEGYSDNLSYSYNRNDGKLSIVKKFNACSSNLIPEKANLSQKTISLLDKVNIDRDINMVNNAPNRFLFDTGKESFFVYLYEDIKQISDITAICNNLRSSSMQTIKCSKYKYKEVSDYDDIPVKFIRLSTSSVQKLVKKLFTGGLDSLLEEASQTLEEISFYEYSPNLYVYTRENPKKAYVVPPSSKTMDFEGIYGAYFWEIFFYMPFLIANTLSLNGKYEEAQKWYNYIFNPTNSSQNNLWKFIKFKNVDKEILENILKNPAQIAIYDNDPFDPDSIAKLRIQAFQKSVFMKYIDNLINWADSLFKKDTWESINQAVCQYVMANELLGKRPREVGIWKAPKEETFQDILNSYGSKPIDQFLIKLENSVKASNDTVLLKEKPFNLINGYFGVNENPVLIEYWDRIEDRLYKIRHCMNIDGIVRQLPLFDPAINPMDLIRSFVTTGGLINLNSVDSCIANYRFAYILEKAKNMANSLIQLGASLLAALEKKDMEALTLIRATQEKNLLKLTTVIKEEQLKESENNLAAIIEAMNSARERYSYYENLIQKGLSNNERNQILAMIASNSISLMSSMMKTLSAAAYLVPNTGSPFAMTYGGRETGSSIEAMSGFFDIIAGQFAFKGSMSQIMAGYERREEEWAMQMNMASYDIRQTEAQVEAAKVRSKIAKRELNIHEKSVQQSTEIEEFLKSKFTNTQLYQWMITRLSAIYYESYKIAFDLARSAQKLYQYELDSNESFINFESWDSLKKGLLSGEMLMVQLNSMEKAYMEKKPVTLEIEKNISLLRLNPKALLDLKTNGVCKFELDEKLFDFDFPGHYSRKIKSISITIPAIVGPYQGIQATLIQKNNQIVIKPDKNAVRFLLGGKNIQKEALNNAIRFNWRANQQIAISRGINDNGIFELNFNTEKYLPFEGTGAVSSWELSMPKASNHIDFDSITDVVINLKYTALSGGEVFKKDVTELEEIRNYQGYRTIILNQEFSKEWYKFMNTIDSSGDQVFNFEVSKEMLPVNLSNVLIDNVYMELLLKDGVRLDDILDLKLCTNQVNNTFYDYCFRRDIRGDSKNIKGALGTWCIKTNKNCIPLNVQKDGLMDKDKILGIVMIISYTGKLNW